MERNLLYNEIANLTNSYHSETKDHFFSAFFDGYLENKYSQASIYSGYTLKIGDNDAKGIYSGKPNQPKSDHVKKLQTDIVDFGITIRSKSTNGIFDFETELAVREFQIYSKMKFVAIRAQEAEQYYGQLLVQQSNGALYKGLITGEVDAYVRRRIQFWKANKYYCPVVIQAWNTSKGAKTSIYSKQDNVWRYNEVLNNTPRIIVKDLSGHYSLPPTSKRDLNEIVLGYRAKGGPEVSTKYHSWAETEFTTEDIFNGLAFGNLAPAQQSTFKIVRAIANSECGGFLDNINGSDNQYISYGPYHWTPKVGEFPSFLSFFKEKAPTAFEHAVGFFGIDLNFAWNVNGQELFVSGSQRKFANGKIVILQGLNHKIVKDLVSTGWGNYFRSWHFFYRFVMAARTIPEFRALTYDFAKMRMRDIRSITLNNFGFTDQNKKAVNPTIGEIFSSEKSFAMILRLHVFRPAWIASVNESGNTLRSVLRSAVKKIKNFDFSTWTIREEGILINELLTYENYPGRQSDVQSTLEGVNNFDYKGLANGTLSEERNFLFDSTNVPTIVYLP